MKITGNTPADGNTNDVEITVSLKYLSNFWRTLEMSLIKCEINLILTRSSTYVITNYTGEGRFAITDTKRYVPVVTLLTVPVVTLLTQDNAKLLQQLKSDFKRTINWNKYKSDPKTYAHNQYLSHLIDSSFQAVNRLFVLSFENRNDRTNHSGCYLPKVEIKDYNIKIDGKAFLDQPINSDIKKYENIKKVATGEGDNYTSVC